MTLANFRPHHRSVVDNTLLVMVCKEVDLKEFGQYKVFGKLVEDLKDLERNGILVHNEHVKGSICFITGDNLGAHGIGGFNESFSTVQYFCRYCKVTAEEFHQDPLKVSSKRNSGDYNEALSLLSGNNSLNSVHGIKFDSIFNSLKYFHVADSGLPPCLAHDIFEGVGSNDVALILKHLMTVKQWFSIEELNHRINTFHYLGSDACSKPCPLALNGGKLGGQAIQNWNFIRLLPIIMHDRIRHARDPHWLMFLLLRDIVEVICAPEIKEADIAYLSILIDEYLEDRKCNFPYERLKPKHHYLKHYPRLILEYGSLIRVWTLRFESKHSFFKQCIKYSQNFINVCKTLAEKHQRLQAYKQTVSFFQDDISVKTSMPISPSTYSQAIQSAIQLLQIQ